MSNHPGRAQAAFPSPSPEEIRAFLISAGWTQARLAQEVRVTCRAAQMWIAGDRAMPAGLWELAQIKQKDY
jgi:transcriptional regulator with XRE-family HTH domain